MQELNPNHHTTRTAHDHWHKIAALLLMKLGGRAVITLADIAALDRDPKHNIVLDDRNNELTLYMVDDQEGMRLARREGGLPQ